MPDTTAPQPQLQITYRPAAALAAAERNPRTHSPAQIAQIAASIQAFGWTNPILIDERQRIIAGHGRLQAAHNLGLHDVPTITLTGLTPAQKRALVIADNQLALNAGWDADILRTELEELGALELDFDLDVVGFSQAEIHQILNLGPDDVELQRPNIPTFNGSYLLPTQHSPGTEPFTAPLASC
jgi:ParB-like chromosome segregation protein Spo0J